MQLFLTSPNSPTHHWHLAYLILLHLSRHELFPLTFASMLSILASIQAKTAATATLIATVRHFCVPFIGVCLVGFVALLSCRRGIVFDQVFQPQLLPAAHHARQSLLGNLRICAWHGTLIWVFPCFFVFVFPEKLFLFFLGFFSVGGAFDCCQGLKRAQNLKLRHAVPAFQQAGLQYHCTTPFHFIKGTANICGMSACPWIPNKYVYNLLIKTVWERTNYPIRNSLPCSLQCFVFTSVIGGQSRTPPPRMHHHDLLAGEWAWASEICRLHLVWFHEKNIRERY